MIEQKQKSSQNTEQEYKLIRILATDIPGNIKVYVGLTRIKGISWSMSNAVCHNLKLDKNKKFGALNESEIEKISMFIKKIISPKMLLNRKADMDSGEDKHLIGTELELQKEFDIKRLKKIKSYRGSRHLHGQPSRGQRTKAHFRSNRKKGVGIKKKAAATSNSGTRKGNSK